MEEEIEIWRDIPGYEGKYQVSNFGRVRSVARWIYRDCRGFPRFQKSRVLYQHANKDGYKTVSLMNGNIHKTHLVHRLVAKVFIPNDNFELDINHIDGVKDNNRVDNLEWCTRKENMRHAFAMGLVGYNNPSNKKKVRIFKDGFEKVFECIEYAARFIKISPSSVSRACSGERPHAGGYKCEFV